MLTQIGTVLQMEFQNFLPVLLPCDVTSSADWLLLKNDSIGRQVQLECPSTMKVKTPKSKDVSEGEKSLESKNLKKQKKKMIKHKPVIDDNQDITVTKKKPKKVQVPEEPSEETKKTKKPKLKKTEKPSDSSPAGKQTPDERNKRKQIRKKKAFNKEAIEKMKARQLAKKEKTMRQSSPAAPPPDAKRRRPKLPIRLETVELNFADDDTMTEFEGVWVPREETGRLQSAREDLEKRGLATEKVDRRMKQLVRREHRKLKLRLIAAQAKTERAAREREQFLSAQQTPRARRRLPGRACGLTLQEGEQLARFDGFWVAAEAVPRLEALRKKLADEGRTENEARRLLRKARRAEERKVKTSGRLLCAKCGGRGHLGSDCTAPARQAAAGTACFRCGEAGHRLSDCPKKGEIAGLPFATCFLCQKQGHMSRECPQAAQDAGQKPGKTPPVGGRGRSEAWEDAAGGGRGRTELARVGARRG